MDVILLKDIEKLGDKHQVVSVKNGYGRNYLIPQKLAVMANPANMTILDELRRKESARREAMLDVYRDMAKQLDGKVLRIGAKAGTSGKIFGSVTNIQLSSALKEQFDVEVERRDIEIPEEVKNIGTYTAILNLHPEVKPQISFEVVEE